MVTSGKVGQQKKNRGAYRKKNVYLSFMKIDLLKLNNITPFAVD